MECKLHAEASCRDVSCCCIAHNQASSYLETRPSAGVPVALMCKHAVKRGKFGRLGGHGPIDGFHAFRAKDVIGHRKVLAPEEPPVRREPGRMHGFKHVVLGGIDELLLGLCMLSPEQEDHPLAFLGDSADGRIGEFFPSLLGMGIGFSGSHREHGVEQEHPLLRPRGEIAMAPGTNSQVIVDLFVDVLQRWRDSLSSWHGKGESHGLSWSVIRILS
mmetsp:Transcript_11027/g.68032  ORF Transcript_11027/g.68032 Transcript_11027/m.68032 type:complete len:217 (-) Transcript_11027:431-1081(-)